MESAPGGVTLDPVSFQAPSANSVRRQLSLLDCFGIGVNGILGSGIFFLPATLARRAGGHAPLAWLLVGGLCCLVALCFAEAAARTEASGGPYRYACDAFGPYIGFGVGWITLISTLLGYAAVARGFGRSAVELLGMVGRTGIEVALSAGVVALLGMINLLGVRLGARIGDGISAVKVLSLLGFIGAGLFFVNWSSLHAPPPAGALLPGESGGLLGAAFAGLFAVTGFEYIPVPAGEAKNPRRTIPLAMVISVMGATLLYALVQIVAGGTDPHLADSSAALAGAAAAFAGENGRKLLGVAAVISSFGFCAGSALVGPRYLEAFAQDRFLPAALCRRSERLGTPVLAVVVLSLLVLGMVLPRGFDFERLADMSNVAVVTQYVATCLSVLVLRHRSAAPAGAFVIPFGPVVPVLALVGSGLALHFVGNRELLWAAGFILAGVALGAVWRRLR